MYKGRSKEVCTVAKYKKRKKAGADYIVVELMKYGGEGMLTMMVTLHNGIWKNE